MIRPATAADIWFLRRRPQRRIFFYTDAMLADSYRPFVVGLRSMLGPMGDDLTTLVLNDGGVRGFLQAHKRPHVPELDITYIAGYVARNHGLPNGDVWFRLAENLLERAGHARIERVFAAVVSRHEDVTEILRQLGFQPYTTQQIWALHEPAIEAGTALMVLRRQYRRDAWPIHQLYTRVTPRHVVQAEQRRAEAWQLPLTRRRIGWHERGWVLGDDGRLDVAIHALTGPRAHVLRPILDPAAREHAPAMLRYALSQLHEPRTVFAVLRGYESELGEALSELGFRQRGEQTLFAKQLAILQRQTVRVPLLRAEPGMESATPLPRIPN